MTKIISFSIAEDYEQAYHILKDKAKNGELSRWLCRMVIKSFNEEQKGVKIDKFVKYETVLDDILPRMWEPLDKELHLKKLDSKELGRLHKMLYYNKGVVDKYVESLIRLEELRKKYGYAGNPEVR